MMNVVDHANKILANGWGVIVPHLIHEDEILDNFAEFLREITLRGNEVKVGYSTSGLTIQIIK